MWAGNGNCIDEIWKNYKDIIFEMSNFMYLKKFGVKYRDTEYYNKDVERLKVKVRKMYNKRKIAQPYHEELKRLSKDLLVAKKKAQETFLRSVLQNKGRC
jgi:hypothetical protein